MSMELIAIFSVGVTIVGVGAVLAGIILNGQRIQRAEMQAQREAIISLLERMAHLE